MSDPIKKNQPSPRALALQTLLGVAGGQYGNLAVDAVLSRHPLSPADRGLYTALVYGVLERQTTLDFMLSRLSDRPPEGLDPAVRTALRLGLYQLIYLDRVPDHAAINETVSLVPRKAGGFVNAVLRAYLRFADSLSRDGVSAPRESRLTTPAEWVARFPTLGGDECRAASVCFGIPMPLCRAYIQAFGYGKAVAVMAGFCRKPPLHLRVNTLRTSPEALVERLAAQGVTVSGGDYLPTALRLDGGNVTGLDGFADGAFFVQDEASQLCVRALDARPGMTVVDVCACPGSKSFGAAVDMGNSGRVLCFDLHESKLSLVRAGAARLGITVAGDAPVLTAAARDARRPDPALVGTADRVLCDVPCSGLGVIAKKPEIRHKDLSESARLPAIQREILEQSAAYLKAGGVLVYSTCTLLPAENRDIVTDFLSRHPDFAPYDFVFDPQPGSAARPIRSTDGMVTLTPDENGTDGFFIARMIKTSKEADHD